MLRGCASNRQLNEGGYRGATKYYFDIVLCGPNCLSGALTKVDLFY